GDDGAVSLAAGENGIAVAASGTATPVSLLLENEQASVLPVEAEPASVGDLRPASMTVDPASGAEVAVLHQNHNPGWEAHQDGEQLEPVVIDGWQQGWHTTGSAEPVQASFAPDQTYRIGLLAGTFGFLGLVL